VTNNANDRRTSADEVPLHEFGLTEVVVSVHRQGTEALSTARMSHLELGSDKRIYQQLLARALDGVAVSCGFYLALARVSQI